MKIRTSLALKYTLVTATVFLFSLIAIYYLSEHIRSQVFYHTLRSEAVTKAHLFLSQKVDAPTMHSIYKNNKSFIHEVEVAVYTPDFRMLYHDEAEHDWVKETPELIREIARTGQKEWFQGTDQVVGVLYHYQGKPYVVTAVAYDGYGYQNLRQLRTLLCFLLFLDISVLFLAGLFLASVALKPIRLLVRETDRITASQISRRLPVRSRDEIGELARTFNELLDRLEHSFNAQKQFVNHASHELRTPLASLMAELDLALQKERTPEQYVTAMQRALGDARKMSRLITGLLDLAKADYGTDQIQMEEFRVDELLLEVRSMVMRACPSYQVDLVFSQETDDERDLTLYGNLYLMRVAFTNLMENNCKYSADHTSLVQISFWKDRLVLRFSDNGIGMTPEEVRQVFTLFYRGSRHASVDGNGIGMTLVQKIVTLHRGTVSVSSEAGKGTTFTLELPHM